MSTGSDVSEIIVRAEAPSGVPVSERVRAALSDAGFEALHRRRRPFEQLDVTQYLALYATRAQWAGSVLAARCVTGSRVLVIGDLFGVAALHLHALGFAVHVLDHFDSHGPALAGVRELLHAEGVHVSTLDGESIEYGVAATRYAAVCALGMVERCAQSPRELLAYAARYLAEKGVLVLDTRNAVMARGDTRVRTMPPIEAAFDAEYSFDGLYRYYTADELRWMLAACGFETYSVTTFDAASATGGDDVDGVSLVSTIDDDTGVGEFVGVCAHRTARVADSPTQRMLELSERMTADALVALGDDERFWRRDWKLADAAGHRLDETRAADLVSQSIRTAVRMMAGGLVMDATQDAVEIELESGLSRTGIADYVGINDLWREAAYAQRIPALPPRRCPTCDTNDPQYLFHSYDGYPFHACPGCHCWYVPYCVDQDFIDGFHAADPRAAAIADRMMRSRNESSMKVDRERFAGYLALLEHLRGGRDDRGRYLDVGCGVGHALDVAAALGFEAWGTEVNGPAIDVGRKHGRNIVHAEALPDDNVFDVISAFETLEHVDEPAALLEALQPRLRDDGLLMITVPNRACLEISVLRERCLHVYGGNDGVGHINLFDARNLHTLLERCGFSVLDIDGQYGSNLLKIAAHLLHGDIMPLDLLSTKNQRVLVSASLHRVLNSIGPAFNYFERIAKRSPILQVIACKTSMYATMSDLVAPMKVRRQRQMAHLARQI